MGGNYRDAWAVCPYYHTQRRREVLCEGFQSAALTRLTFATEDDRARYCMRYCNNIKGYNDCPLLGGKDEGRRE